MALVEVSVVPVGTGSPSFSSVVSQALREAHESGVKYEVNATSTVLEGDLPVLLDVARKMHEAAFTGGVRRVVTNISIDDRKDRDLRMEEATRAAESGL